MSALARAKQEIETVKEKRSAQLKRIRDKTKEAAEKNEHTIMAVGTAMGIGYFEGKGTDFPTLGNIDHKLLYGGGALLTAYMSKDARLKRIAQSVGDGLVSASAYAKGVKLGAEAKRGSVSGYGEDIVGEGEI